MFFTFASADNNLDKIRNEYNLIISDQNIAIRKLTEKKKIEECNIGIYRLVMKAGSDNFRESAIQDIINSLKEKGAKI